MTHSFPKGYFGAVNAADLPQTTHVAHRGRGSHRPVRQPFFDFLDALPPYVQKLAQKNYELWQADRNRALGRVAEDTIEWVWIGSHEEYNKL